MPADTTGLPIEAALPALRDALEAHSSAVLVAPPGAGKTTRVPLALLDAPWRGDGRIIVLEPRRLAARAAAARMAMSLGQEVGATVGYRVRMDAKVSKATRIEVVTEGVFTRMILDDPELAGIAAVLFDEFHERSFDGDLGLALALDTQGALRPDLRILVMSATLDGARVARLLDDAPVVESLGRMYPVDTRYFGRDTGKRIEDEMASAIRRALGEETGSILAFLPGQAEIRRCVERLDASVAADVELAPLYGALTPAEQDRAIRPALAGRRKVVLATSIAETSLTIEGVRIVIDSGLSRLPAYEPATGMTRLETRKVSRASADQRRGRAGRTEPGVCYRLWDEPQTTALAAFDPPEILEADLAGLALDLAQWGVADPSALTFLDPPPKAAWDEAIALLKSLDALDETGQLTPDGRALARMPLHPRLAHMIVRASAEGLGRLGADIAAVVSERGLGGTGTDLEERVRRFRQERGGRADDARRMAARWARLADPSVKEQGHGNADLADTGRVLAFAYPDRVAQARGSLGSFRLANGRGGMVEPHDGLAKAPFLAIAELQGSAANARILLAASLDKADIEADFATHIVETTDVRLDDAKGLVRARRVRRFGAVELDERIVQNPSPEDIADALLAGLISKGMDRLPWSKSGRALIHRIGFARRADPERWPDFSADALSRSARDWLRPLLIGKRSLGDIDGSLLDAALDGLLDWNLRRDLDRLAPTHFEAPTGSHVPLDYEAENGPVLSIRVQELFGLARHPAIADGRVPLLVELLSPAHRPIQVTRDLPGFWGGSWRDVKVEMKGRYPRHVWPDDPANAAPTSRAKPRGT